MGHNLRIAFVLNEVGAVEVQPVPLLAALALGRGHRVELVEFAPNPRRAQQRLAEFAPDIVAYSVCSNEAVDYLDINRRLKKGLRFFAVFGGPHPTFSPEYVREDGVDAICRGEGDVAFPKFLDAFGSEAMYSVENFSFRLPDGQYRENPLTDLLTDLDSLPFAARELLYQEIPFMGRNPIKALMAGRGCPNRCSYCFNYRYNAMYAGKGRILRVKSVSYLLREVADLAARFPLKFVRFYDDIFGADIEWLTEFAERFPKEAGVPFTCNVRPNMVTEEYVQLLKRAGCYSVYTAIECGDEERRNEFLGRNLTDAQISRACECLKRHGIRIASLNMIGLPGETEDDILETLRMNVRLGVDVVDMNIFQPYPGTRAHEYCCRQGYLKEESRTLYESFATRSVLDIDPALKQRIFLLHKLGALLVDYPALMRFAHHLPKTTRLNGLFTFFFRLYFGYVLHRRIYASKIPIWVRALGLGRVLFSRNRV